jgi:long-chain acyl-CoA synthetase
LPGIRAKITDMDVSNAPPAPQPWRTRFAHPGVWEQDFPPLALTDMFAQSVAAHDDRPLIEFMGRRTSYSDVMTQARAFAAGLQAMGIGKGDRIGLYLPNVPVYVPAYYGALIAGVTLVNFSPLYTAHELEAQVADSGARLLVTVDLAALLPTALKVLAGSTLEKLVVASFADMLPFAKSLALRLFGRKMLSPLPHQDDVVSWRAALGVAAPTPVAIDPLHDLALLQYTGGTTGTPKGAMLTHQNLSANARQIWSIDPDKGARDMVLAVLPLFHVFANTCILNRTVLNGGCIAMLPRFDAGQLLATVRRVKPTAMFAVPTMLQAMLDYPATADTDFSSVRECISGGAPLALPLKERFEAATGIRVVEGYGLTESSGVVSTNPLGGGGYAGTIGQPLPATRIRLLDKVDATQDAAAGEPGELAIQGPQVMQGYWNLPEAAASAFAMRDDGRWLRTGDIATIDAEGYLAIVDRSKDMIAVGGFKVFPSQVEAVLVQHPAVKEVLVIGVPDAYRGEAPRAYVTVNTAISGDELKDWLNQLVGKHERVDAVVIRDALPKTAIGKLDRKALRDEIARDQIAKGG